MMFSDRYGLSLSTRIAAARDAYLEGCDLLLTLYPGALAAFDRAIAADPGFALSYVGKARAQQAGGDPAGARQTLALTDQLSPAERDRSQIDILKTVLAGQADPALAALKTHLKRWPLDALVLSFAASQTGLIALSGRPERISELAAFLDDLADEYGQDWWFNAHYGMALSETGQQAKARPRIEQSLAANPRNGTVAHAHAHYLYEEGDHDSVIGFLRPWLETYPRTGLLFGHLHWHLALSELQQGDPDSGARRYGDAFAADDYTGPALFKLFDGVSFLWRCELAGYPRDVARWQQMHAFAQQNMPQPGLPYADWHIALTDAVSGDTALSAARRTAMEKLVAENRYPAGSMVLALTDAFAAFERNDPASAISALAPLMAERERIGGSRAQIDLVDFTLMKALLQAGRPADLAHVIAQRRPGPKDLPISGLRS
jgi:tetratricopeptide (TPR) repeat protein